VKAHLSKARVRLLARLRTRHRAREGRFMVEGIRGGEEVLRAGVPVDFAVVSPRLDATPRGSELRAGLEARGFEVLRVEDDELADLADTATPQGVLLVCPEPQGDLALLPVGRGARYLVLDGIQDPGNLGTLVRAAGAFGVSGIVALHGTTDPWSPKAVRASAGALLGRPLARSSIEVFLEWARDHGVALWGADTSGQDVSSVRPDSPWGLVVGNEGGGVSPPLREAVLGLVAVPMPGGTESLNVGVAGAILLYVLTTRPGGD
jgi:RNA methyltransferase, TrmH family